MYQKYRIKIEILESQNTCFDSNLIKYPIMITERRALSITESSKIFIWETLFRFLK